MSESARAWLLRLRSSATAPPPACAPDTVAAAARLLGRDPVGWAAEVALAMATDIVRQIPEHGGDTAFPSFRRAVEATTLLALCGLLTEQPATSAALAPEAVASNAELARRGVPLDRVLRGVRLGHACLHRRLMEVLDKEPEDVRVPETHRVSESLFVYADLQASRLAEEYLAERERWRRSTTAARRRIVDDILAGRVVGDAVAAHTLGYDLARHHAAFIVTSRSPHTAEPELRLLASEVTRAVGGQHLLTVPAGPGELWAWTCWPAPPPEALTRLPERVEEHWPLLVALGPVGHGVEGFRRSHRGAREAERVARLGGTNWLCDYSDIAAAALLTADTENARWFASGVLGPLAGADSRAQELRETLRVYLAEGRSPQSAAERLFVARNTVTYRVRRAEELMGRPLGTDGLDVRLALEIVRLLGPC